MLVLALGGGGLWALTRSSDPLSMVKAPILQAQQDLSNLGKEPTAAPFDASGTVAFTSHQLTILRVIADHRETLVALSASSSSSYSAWQVPVPDDLAGQYLNCQVNAKTFDCGDQISVDLASGINSPAKPSTVSANAPTAPASPVAPQASDNRSAAPAQNGTSKIPNGMAPTNPVGPAAPPRRPVHRFCRFCRTGVTEQRGIGAGTRLGAAERLPQQWNTLVSQLRRHRERQRGQGLGPEA